MQPKNQENGRSTLLTRILCVLLLAALLLPGVYILSHAEHDCTGDNCAVCLNIQHAQESLTQAGTGTALPSLFLAFCAIAAVLALVTTPLFPFKSTLVGQKVRIDI